MLVRRPPVGLALLTLVALLAGLIVVACGSGPQTRTSAPPDAGLLGFRAPLVGSGDELDGSTLVGSPVALRFWAPT